MKWHIDAPGGDIPFLAGTRTGFKFSPSGSPLPTFRCCRCRLYNGMLDQGTNSSHPALEHRENGAEDQQDALVGQRSNVSRAAPP